jgi:hypothetical protein
MGTKKSSPYHFSIRGRKNQDESIFRSAQTTPSGKDDQKTEARGANDF